MIREKWLLLNRFRGTVVACHMDADRDEIYARLCLTHPKIVRIIGP
jgi:hypothetical protein